ncbi:hypothetical protein PFISCL1PPCAC_18580, partial [Pristionchus fissidentatus]
LTFLRSCRDLGLMFDEKIVPQESSYSQKLYLSAVVWFRLELYPILYEVLERIRTQGTFIILMHYILRLEHLLKFRITLVLKGLYPSDPRDRKLDMK